MRTQRWVGASLVMGWLVAVCWAAEGSNPIERGLTSATEGRPSSASAAPTSARPAPSDRQAKIAEATVQLNGAWTIQLKPMAGPPPKRPLKDTLRFEQGKISSDALTSKGYEATNYTLTIGDDDVPVWETMQSNEAEGVVFWRGELHQDALQGIMSKHPVEGTSEDYSFAGTQISRAESAQPSSSTPAAAVAAPSASSAAHSEPAVPAGSPKKAARKGWFGR